MTPINPEPEGGLYQTDLAQTPLPELLAKIHRYKAPGRIECQRGDVIKRIYLERGEIIFATTNQIAESLGDRLLNAGRITRAQYEQSLCRVIESGKRHGVTLVEMNILTADELFTAVREQIEEIVWSIFTWDFGAVTYTPGRDKHLEFVKVSIPVPQAILRGVLRIPDARALLSRIGTRTTLLERRETAGDLTLQPDEEALLAAATGKVPLPDLVQTPPNPPLDNVRILYGLFVLGLLAPKERLKVQLKTSRTTEE